MKKIMILMLSLAVLFSFAACDNENGGSSSFQEMVVTSIEITAGPEKYFSGETLDAKDYTVVATRLNGETFTVEAKDLSITGTLSATSNDDVKTEKVGTISYNGSFALSSVTADVMASVYSLNAIDVEKTGAAKQYYTSQNATDVTRADYVVTAYAIDSDDNVVYSRALEADEYTINDDEDDSFASGTVALTFAPVASIKGTFSTNPAGYDNTSTISVAPDTVKNISLALIDADEDDYVEAIVGATAGNPEQYVEVTYIMASGVETTTKPSNAETVTYAWQTGFNDQSVFTESPVTITATYGTGTTAPTAMAQVKPVANYIKSFTVSATYATASDGDTDSVKETLTITKGTAGIKTADFTVTPTWADNAHAPENAPDAATLTAALVMSDGVTDNLKTFSTAGYGDGAKLPISFSLSGLTFANEKTTCEITTVVMGAGA